MSDEQSVMSRTDDKKRAREQLQKRRADDDDDDDDDAVRSKKKVEIRDFFAESRNYLDLDSVVYRLYFGTKFRNYTRTLVRMSST